MDEQFSSPVSRVDRISALPGEIISIILSKLSIEESARTSILSKRWPEMWLLSPITISDESIIMQSSAYFGDYSDSVWIVNVMSHIISTHPGPVHTCYFSLPIWEDHYKTLLELLKLLTQKGIQNLQINFQYEVLEVPCFILICESLVEVELENVSMPDQLPTGRDILPNVRKLTMTDCYVSDEFLVNLLRSKSIVELKLNICMGFKEIVIKSESLQKIFFDGGELDTKLIIRDAPNLTSFEYVDFTISSKVVILNAPKLKVLRTIKMDISMIQLGNCRFKFHKKYMEISGEITCMPSLRSLEIVVDFGCGYEAKAFPHFLMCFPCLDTLEVHMISYPCFDSSSSDSSSDDDDKDDAAAAVIYGDYDSYVHPTSNINCLNHRLKELRMKYYSGSKAHLDFAKHIIVNARVLERVTVVCDYAFGATWIKAQRRCLMQDRASEMLRVEFHKE